MFSGLLFNILRMDQHLSLQVWDAIEEEKKVVKAEKELLWKILMHLNKEHELICSQSSVF